MSREKKICLRCVAIQAHDALLFPLGYVGGFFEALKAQTPESLNPYSEK